MNKRQKPSVNLKPEKQTAGNQPSCIKPPDASANQPQNLQPRRTFKRKAEDVECAVCLRMKYELRK
ncbi:hypothetical protein ZHAS_00004490 [Anopheles sinensis]|uniref:Uncharacterized protein n=1 Tax=Anopheles sinensis TaxID=74873 RepID=A0A084VH25_ANOSI|nr:hypothetical protein ZHAS_00004490 [Anopheles sinensis]